MRGGMRTGMRGGMHSGDDPTHGFPARIAGLGRGTTLTHSFRAAAAALRLDPGQLPIRDRAVLRILNRARLANAEQLGILVYRNRHYAQIRLRRLWELGYLERLRPPATDRASAARPTCTASPQPPSHASATHPARGAVPATSPTPSTRLRPSARSSARAIPRPGPP